MESDRPITPRSENLLITNIVGDHFAYCDAALGDVTDPLEGLPVEETENLARSAALAPNCPVVGEGSNKLHRCRYQRAQAK